MRNVAVGIVILLVIVGAGWTALWFYASHETETRLAAWIEAEAAQGRTWTCPDRRTGGYPFALTIDCTAPTYVAHALDRTDTVAAAALTAEVAPTHPNSVAVRLKGPLTYRSGADTDLKATWHALDLDLGREAVAIHATGVGVAGTFGNAGRQGGQADALDATFAGGRGDDTLDFSIAVKGAPVAALDALIGDRAPADIALAGQLDHATPVDARTPEEAIEAWRRAGGRITLASSRILRGSSSVSATGTIGLDDAHRPQGRLAASFVGLEPILKRYGISANFAAAGALLNSLFGGGKPAPASTPGALDLPISLQNGRLGIGPVRTPIQLQPLY